MKIALIAHDSKKKDLIEWAMYNKDNLISHNLYATGTTGKLLDESLKINSIIRKKSGPLGGDQEIGSIIANNELDLLIFFWDGMDVHVHNTDIQALLRLCVVYNVPVACNRSTADMIISSKLFNSGYKREMPDFSNFLNRTI